MSVEFVTSYQRVVQITAVALALAVSVTACGDKNKADKPASQTAAKVNKEEITVHQINQLLQQQRDLPPEQVELASKAALERLVDQELAIQKAGELKLDRDARVVQQIEAARREIIARAYVQKVSDGAGKATPEEVKKYYDENPNLFGARRVYQIQEFVIEADASQVATLTARLKAAKGAADFAEYLKSQQIKFTTNQGIRPAEQLPMSALSAFAAMKDGDSRATQTPTGMRVVALLGSRSQPVDLERARPAIEAFLVNDRKRKIIADDMKALRAAATIQYVGKFAQTAASAAASAPTSEHAAPAVVAPVLEAASAAAPAASGSIDAATISKGLGLK